MRYLVLGLIKYSNNGGLSLAELTDGDWVGTLLLLGNWVKNHDFCNLAGS